MILNLKFILIIITIGICMIKVKHPYFCEQMPITVVDEYFELLKSKTLLNIKESLYEDIFILSAARNIYKTIW